MRVKGRGKKSRVESEISRRGCQDESSSSSLARPSRRTQWERFVCAWRRGKVYREASRNNNTSTNHPPTYRRRERRASGDPGARWWAPGPRPAKT